MNHVEKLHDEIMGLLDHKVTTVERSDGTSKIVEQVLVTPKGLTKLAQVVGGVA